MTAAAVAAAGPKKNKKNRWRIVDGSFGNINTLKIPFVEVDVLHLYSACWLALLEIMVFNTMCIVFNGAPSEGGPVLNSRPGWTRAGTRTIRNQP